MTSIYLKRAIKFFWVFTWLVFLSVLIYVYASLPLGDLGISFNLTTIKAIHLDKASTFYWFLGFFIFSNIAWYTISKLVWNYKTSAKSSVNGRFLSYNRILSLVNWLNSFSVLINILFIFALAYINFANAEHKYGIGLLETLIYGVLIALGSWVLLLVYLLLKKQQSHIEA